MADKSKEQEVLHEALDRAHITSSHLQMALGEHPVIEEYQDIRMVYSAAVAKIEELYQLIGSKIE